MKTRYQLNQEKETIEAAYTLLKLNVLSKEVEMLHELKYIKDEIFSTKQIIEDFRNDIKNFEKQYDKLLLKYKSKYIQ
jgi:hypothetical protein